MASLRRTLEAILALASPPSAFEKEVVLSNQSVELRVLFRYEL
jgi:hypothetical protein